MGPLESQVLAAGLQWWGSKKGLDSMCLGYVTPWSCPVTGQFYYLEWEGSYLGETTVLFHVGWRQGGDISVVAHGHLSPGCDLAYPTGT